MPDERAYLGRVLRVLDVVAASEQAVSMSEICRQMSLPMTTVHRLLVTLWKAGVLERDVRRRYVMGTRLTVLSSGSGSSGDAA
ncbi:helix-turn-helix domain-containing protein [Actinosynnema sp. NPDC047251]|uniref:helix-turn-helix domain-containing protein n=1 Tax=Saccharothrix espanaensis TaxID=103731 RepID=UPI00059E73F4|nr:helix-turn-helix domain-containing protein [Saccharothrix espanaensis]